ncbi:VOC family protein [Microdochium nivale]|nr:VOC family protein [Microdochium nivale]
MVMSTAGSATAASPSTSPSSSSSSSRTVTLDHIVILVPYSYLALPGLESSQTTATTTTAPPPPNWFRDLFSFSPGGRHTDGVTENVLVLLRDGVYLEFIAFTPEAERDGARLRRGHRWGKFVEGGVVDWAVTVFHPAADEVDSSHDGRQGESRARQDYDDVVRPITQRVLQRSRCGDEDGGAAELAVVYGDLTPGGRKRPDGVQLEWATVPAVAVPASADDGSSGGDERQQQTRPVQPGQAPFWCLDETPRGLRVPYRRPPGDGGVGTSSRTEHASTGAVGVAKVQVTPAPGVTTARRLGRLFGEMFPDGGGGGDGEKKQSRWALPAPEGTRFHPHGVLEVQEADTAVTTGTKDPSGGEAGDVVVSLYTDRPELVGKRVGGEVEGGNGIWFELVGV